MLIAAAADAATQIQPLHPAPCDRKELLNYWNTCETDAIYVGISQYVLDQGHIGFGVFAKKKLTVDMTLAERTLRAQLEVQLVQQQAKMAQLEQELTSQKASVRGRSRCSDSHHRAVGAACLAAAARLRAGARVASACDARPRRREDARRAARQQSNARAIPRRSPPRMPPAIARFSSVVRSCSRRRPSARDWLAPSAGLHRFTWSELRTTFRRRQRSSACSAGSARKASRERRGGRRPQPRARAPCVAAAAAAVAVHRCSVCARRHASSPSSLLTSNLSQPQKV